MLNEVFEENCLETMKRMPDCFVDLVVTSPPYDDLRTYNGYSFDFVSVVESLFRVVKDGGVVVWIVGDATKNGSETGTSFRQALGFIDAGFRLHDTMIWKKTNPMPKVKTKRYFDVFEYMFVFSKGQPNTFNAILQDTKFGGKVYSSTVKQISTGMERVAKTFVLNESRFRDNIWEFAVAQNKTAHPAVFPEALITDHIVSWSNEGDLVYDPFLGSGTTALAASKLDRFFVGSEISKEYVQIARERIEMEIGLWS
jgi:site-specific DNA-methyltransferase (adenine-specific)